MARDSKIEVPSIFVSLPVFELLPATAVFEEASAGCALPQVKGSNTHFKASLVLPVEDDDDEDPVEDPEEAANDELVEVGLPQPKGSKTQAREDAVPGLLPVTVVTDVAAPLSPFEPVTV